MSVKGGYKQNHGKGFAADVGPAPTCQHSDGCDQPAIKGSSYCQEHYDRCYKPVPPAIGRSFNVGVKHKR